MNTEEICRKYVDFGKETMKTVIYCIVAENGKNCESETYGISITIPETSECVCIRDITTYRHKAEHLLDLMATGFVTPATAADIVEDWLGR